MNWRDDYTPQPKKPKIRKKQKKHNIAHIRVYPLNSAFTGLRYQGEREDGTPIEGCAETALASSQKSRFSALYGVVRCIEATEEFDGWEVPKEAADFQPNL